MASARCACATVRSQIPQDQDSPSVPVPPQSSSLGPASRLPSPSRMRSASRSRAEAAQLCTNAMPASSRLGGLFEAAALETLRLSLSLAESDAAVLDAQVQMDLSLASSGNETEPRQHQGAGSKKESSHEPAVGTSKGREEPPSAPTPWTSESRKNKNMASKDSRGASPSTQNTAKSMKTDPAQRAREAAMLRDILAVARKSLSDRVPRNQQLGQAEKEGEPDLHKVLNLWAWGSESGYGHEQIPFLGEGSPASGFSHAALRGVVGRAELSNVVKALGQQGLPRWAYAVFRWMEQQASHTQLESVSPQLLDGSDEPHTLSHVFIPQPLQRSGGGRLRPNGHTFSLILGILGRAGMVREAMEVFGKFRAADFRDRVHAFNAMLAAHVRQGDLDSAWSLFQEMLKAGENNRGKGEVKGEEREGKDGEAEINLRRPLSIRGTMPLDRMKEWGMDELLEQATSAMLPRAPQKSAPKRPKSDTETSTGGLSAAPTPDVVSFNTMIGACLPKEGPGREHKERKSTGGEGERWGKGGAERALWLFHEMERRGVRANARTFNALLGVLGREKRWHHMESVLDSMRTKGVPPDMYTYNILISAHCRALRLSDALRFYAMALSEGLQPTDVTLSALMSGFSATGRMREALAAFQQLEQQARTRGEKPDTTAFCGLMAVYKEAGRADDAEVVFRRMIAEGAAPNTIAYSCLIQAYGREGRLEEATRVFEEMLGSGDSECFPDVQAFNVLMSAYGQHGMSLHVSRLFRSLQNHGLTPDTVTYNTMIHAFVVAGQPKQAEGVLQHMLASATCQPDSVTRTLMLRAYNDAGWHDKVKGLRRRRRLGKMSPQEL